MPDTQRDPQPAGPTGRRFLIVLMLATILVPVICVVLAIVLSSWTPVLWGVVPTLFLGLAWYTAESGHRKSAHPSRTPGRTAHPLVSDD